MAKSVMTPQIEKSLSGRAMRLVAAVFALAFSMMLLASCASSESKPADGGATIDVTVAVAANEDKGIAAQEQTVEVAEGATVLVATEATEFKPVVEDSEYGAYVSSLNGVAAEGNAGWVYTVNGESVMEGADACVLEAGDSVEWSYMSW